MVTVNTSSINRELRKLWIAYALFVVYGTLLPFSLCLETQCILDNIQRVSWTPFMDNDGSRASISDMVQNILFFIPFGFLGILSQRPYSVEKAFGVTLLGALLSASVECLQLLTVNRTSSITDLVTNVLGTIVGVLLVFLLTNWSKTMFRYPSLQSLRNDRHFHLLLIGLGLITLGTLQPFDVTLDVGNVWSNVKSLMREPFRFTPPKDDGVVALRFLLFSWLLCIWLHRRGWPSVVLTAFIMSCLIGVGLELSQVIIRSRLPGVQDTIVVLIGSFMGCALFRIKPSPERDEPILWVVSIIVLSWLSAVMHILSPFIVNDQYQRFNWLPFMSYYERTTFVALSNFIESVLLFFPLGFILKLLISDRKNAVLGIAIICLSIAVPLEVLQGRIVGRYPDITDVAGALAGVLLASWSAKHFLAIPYISQEMRDSSNEEQQGLKG